MGVRKAKPPTLDYEATTPRTTAQPRGKVFACASMVVALVVAVVFWWRADWWVYFGSGDYEFRDYELPTFIQIVVSAGVGAGAGIIVFGVLVIVDQSRSVAPRSVQK